MSKNTDQLIKALAADVGGQYLVVHAPGLFARRVTPVPSPDQAAAITALIDDVLRPMAKEAIQHPLLNRVRLSPKAPLLPYRIVICSLDESDPSLGFVASLRTHDQDPFTPANAARIRETMPRLRTALTDRLDAGTGLLSLPAFEAEVAIRGGAGDTACVVYANLDRVHVINELSGFAAADSLIRDVGRYFQSQAAPTGSIATHLSGDRFAAVLFDHTLNQARTWAEETREGIRRLGDDQVPARVTASFGVATLGDADSFQHALAAAETACRVAKERGRNRVELYVNEDHTVMRRHEEVRESREIIEALDHGSFTLYAQPIMSLTDPGYPTHYEVLLRVARPDGTVTSIANFLDAAERYQLLERLDRWVLTKVLSMIGPMAADLHKRGASFAVNITGQSLSQESFADFVRGEIKRHDLPAGLLDFELTETAAVRNLKATQRFIARLAEIGAGVALDDFGTGLSSLMHLKDLDVNRIKIDGKFVRDVLSNARSRALIRALVQIADEIGLQTVAEFVESEAIAASVHALGVQWAQGYFFGRPRPLEDVLADLMKAPSQDTYQITTQGEFGWLVKKAAATGRRART
jgi:Amt family ammonium transporter